MLWNSKLTHVYQVVNIGVRGAKGELSTSYMENLCQFSNCVLNLHNETKESVVYTLNVC